IQQDAICELHEAVIGASLQIGNLPAWQAIRALRHICAGHPAKRSRGTSLTRTFMGRTFGGYGGITYEMWQAGAVTHVTVALGLQIDSYAVEAEQALQSILGYMKKRWPQGGPS